MEEKKLSLYNIVESMRMLEDMEVEDIQSYLDSIDLQKEEKVDNIIKFVRSLDASAQAIDIEITRLSALRDSMKKKSKSLLDYVDFVMKKFSMETITTSIAKLSFRKAKSVLVTDEEAIPRQYFKERTTVTLDKARLLADLKTGVQVPGAELQENKHLQVK